MGEGLQGQTVCARYKALLTVQCFACPTHPQDVRPTPTSLLNPSAAVVQPVGRGSSPQSSDGMITRPVTHPSATSSPHSHVSGYLPIQGKLTLLVVMTACRINHVMHTARVAEGPIEEEEGRQGKRVLGEGHPTSFI